VRRLTEDVLDICKGLPRSYLYRPRTLDPIFQAPLESVLERLKGGSAQMYDPESFPKVERDWDSSLPIHPAVPKADGFYSF
jgi:hypothetical protein